jgi:hypothetical protein
MQQAHAQGALKIANPLGDPRFGKPHGDSRAGETSGFNHFDKSGHGCKFVHLFTNVEQS